MKPWNIGSFESKTADEFSIPLWLQCTAKEFYFNVNYQKDIKASIVYITPIDYFDKHCQLYYDSMPILHILPNYLEEIMECVYETKLNENLLTHNLQRLGYRRDPYFDKFIDSVCNITGNALQER